MNIFTSSRLTRSVAGFLSLVILLGVSQPAFASSKASSEPASASLTTASLAFPTGARIVISGTTQNTTKVRFTIIASSTSKTLFKSKVLKVSKGGWGGTVSKKLPNGTYTVTVNNADGSHKEKLIQGTLVVGQPEAILKVSPIALLTGGNAQPGQTIPISYLQVQNLSDSPVAIRGFELSQTGTAPDASIVAFSSVDGSGGSQGNTTDARPLVKGMATVPSSAILAPHERKLFTLKAQVSSVSNSFSGKSLSLSVTGVDADAQLNATFPILGTTWVIAR